MSWIPIKQYIQEYGISDSTIRRRIRSNKLRSKKVEGKWFIWSDGGKSVDGGNSLSSRGVEDDVVTSRNKKVRALSRGTYRKEISGDRGPSARDDRAFSNDKTEAIGEGAYSVEPRHFSLPKSMGRENGSISEIIDFSSKALNSYLITNDKLINEKEKRIEEKDELIKTQRQKIVELEYYIKTLERLERKLREEREKPEGWK